MKRIASKGWLTLAVLLVAPVGAGPQQQTLPSQSAPAVEVLMEAKLAHAKELLEALALEDFDKIRTNAQQLELLSRDAGWIVLQTQAYRQLSDEFRRASRMMAESAAKKNLRRR